MVGFCDKVEKKDSEKNDATKLPLCMSFLFLFFSFLSLSSHDMVLKLIETQRKESSFIGGRHVPTARLILI